MKSLRNFYSLIHGLFDYNNLILSIDNINNIRRTHKNMENYYLKSKKCHRRVESLPTLKI